MFDSCHIAVVYCSSAVSALALNEATCSESSLVCAISFAFSSGAALATCLPISFWRARASSNCLSEAAFLVGTEHLVDEFDGFAAFAL